MFQDYTSTGIIQWYQVPGLDKNRYYTEVPGYRNRQVQVLDKGDRIQTSRTTQVEVLYKDDRFIAQNSCAIADEVYR